MVDFTSLNAAATATVSGFHNYAQNIETARLGNLYSKAFDGLNYYVVECVAKPALEKAPEWMTDNLAVSTIRNNQGLSIVVGISLAVASLVSFIIWLHPEGTTSKPPRAGFPDPNPNPQRTRSLGSEEEDGTEPTPRSTLRTHSAEEVPTKGDVDADVDDKSTSASGGAPESSSVAAAAQAKVLSSNDDDGDVPVSTTEDKPKVAFKF